VTLDPGAVFPPAADPGRLVPPRRPPLVLIADDQEWTARAFESVLAPAGFAVLRCASAWAALEQVRTVSPDVVLVKADLPGLGGAALCRLLREEARVGGATPVFVTAAAPQRRDERLEALRAGAWDVLTLPLDAEELLLKLGVMVQAKLEADRAREEGLLDLSTGLYSVHGLLRRVREMGLEAVRHPALLACAVLAPDEAHGEERAPAPGDDALTRQMVRLMTRSGRRSDVVGRISQTEFAVLAPQTDPRGVLLLARRLVHDAAALEGEGEEGGVGPRFGIRVGCFAVDDFSDAALEPVELLVRATMALRRAQRDAAAAPVCFFDQAVSMS
jgi:PleD family two-component response regulator